MNQSNTYLGNPNVKRDGVLEDWTEATLLEYRKCMKNPTYFAKKYCKVISLDEGLIPFTLYPYQEKMFKHFDENRFSVVLACRQSGKSISSVAYLSMVFSVSHREDHSNPCKQRCDCERDAWTCFSYVRESTILPSTWL